jgi:hypothetical protein
MAANLEKKRGNEKEWEYFVSFYLHLIKNEKESPMKSSKLLAVLLCVLAMAILQGCDYANIEMVKNGHLHSCPSKTMSQMVNGFMGDPEWTGGTGSDGNSYVNVSGNITYYGKQVRATYQFRVDGETFQFNALEFNGIPQNMLMSLALLNKMCTGE